LLLRWLLLLLLLLLRLLELIMLRVDPVAGLLHTLLLLLLLCVCIVVYELAQQSSSLQGVVWPCALTQCEAAADGQPVTCPYTLGEALHKTADVDGLQVLPQVPCCQLAALLLLLAECGRWSWGCAWSHRCLLHEWLCCLLYCLLLCGLLAVGGPVLACVWDWGRRCILLCCSSTRDSCHVHLL
jgi:hypothetical protein